MSLVKKFHRKKGLRRAFFRGLAVNLITYGKITTTPERAKALRPIIERLVSIARRNSVSDMRMVMARLANNKAGERLFYDIAPKYIDRNGGYTRIVKLQGRRMRDGASLATIEFV